MKKLAITFLTFLGVCALGVAIHAPVAGAQAPPGPMAPAQQQAPAPGTPEAREAQAAAKIVTAYTLPPDLYAKTKHIEKIKLAFFTLSPIYGLIVLWLLLRWKIGPKYRDWAEGASLKFVLQVLIFAPLFVLTLDILNIPLGIFEQWELRNYGLSVQGWGSWAWDWTKGELVSVITGFVFILILYAVIRKSPRLWWFYFWLASLPMIALLIFLQPVVIDPLFHKFEPMQAKNPALTVALEQMIQRAGQDIPPERIYWMNASEKVNELNAYVTGIGASKRMVVWDTTIAKMNTPQVVTVCGHEMGHYVLNHIPKALTIAAIGSLILFFLGYRLIGGFLAWGGPRWGIRSLGDLASLPTLLLLLAVASFILTPATNGLSRYFEHQADQYALEVTHGLTPDSGQVAAQAFQVLGEVDLDYPDPGPIDVFLTYDHPATRDRVRFSLTYNPWANGGTGEFVH
jgi:Zn-dependent protease with chaperone function